MTITNMEQLSGGLRLQSPTLEKPYKSTCGSFLNRIARWLRNDRSGADLRHVAPPGGAESGLSANGFSGCFVGNNHELTSGRKRPEGIIAGLTNWSRKNIKPNLYYAGPDLTGNLKSDSSELVGGQYKSTFRSAVSKNLAGVISGNASCRAVSNVEAAGKNIASNLSHLCNRQKFEDYVRNLFPMRATATDYEARIGELSGQLCSLYDDSLLRTLRYEDGGLIAMALAQVCGGDAQRALGLLTAIGGQPLPSEAPAPEGASQQRSDLFRVAGILSRSNVGFRALVKLSEAKCGPHESKLPEHIRLSTLKILYQAIDAKDNTRSGDVGDNDFASRAESAARKRLAGLALDQSEKGVLFAWRQGYRDASKAGNLMKTKARLYKASEQWVERAAFRHQRWYTGLDPRRLLGMKRTPFSNLIKVGTLGAHQARPDQIRDEYRTKFKNACLCLSASGASLPEKSDRDVIRSAILDVLLALPSGDKGQLTVRTSDKEAGIIGLHQVCLLNKADTSASAAKQMSGQKETRFNQILDRALHLNPGITRNRVVAEVRRIAPEGMLTCKSLAKMNKDLAKTAGANGELLSDARSLLNELKVIESGNLKAKSSRQSIVDTIKTLVLNARSRNYYKAADGAVRGLDGPLLGINLGVEHLALPLTPSLKALGSASRTFSFESGFIGQTLFFGQERQFAGGLGVGLSAGYVPLAHSPQPTGGSSTGTPDASPTSASATPSLIPGGGVSAAFEASAAWNEGAFVHFRLPFNHTQDSIKLSLPPGGATAKQHPGVRMADFVQTVFGRQTPPKNADDLWDKIAEKYLDDEEISIGYRDENGQQAKLAFNASAGTSSLFGDYSINAKIFAAGDKVLHERSEQKPQTGASHAYIARATKHASSLSVGAVLGAGRKEPDLGKKSSLLSNSIVGFSKVLHEAGARYMQRLWIDQGRVDPINSAISISFKSRSEWKAFLEKERGLWESAFGPEFIANFERLIGVKNSDPEAKDRKKDLAPKTTDKVYGFRLMLTEAVGFQLESLRAQRQFYADDKTPQGKSAKASIDADINRLLATPASYTPIDMSVVGTADSRTTYSLPIALQLGVSRSAQSIHEFTEYIPNFYDAYPIQHIRHNAALYGESMQRSAQTIKRIARDLILRALPGGAAVSAKEKEEILERFIKLACKCIEWTAGEPELEQIRSQLRDELFSAPTLS